MEVVSSILISSLCVLVYLWSRHRSSRMKTLPPGPPGWPIVGNLVQIILEKRHFMHIVRDLRVKYGPIFTLKMGQRTLVIISSSELIHEALVQKGQILASRPPDSPIRLLFSIGKCTMNAAEYGPVWRTLRRNFLKEVISPIRIRQCSWIRKWAFEEHMKMIEIENSQQGFVDVLSNCRLTVLRILLSLCLGFRIPKDQINYIDSIIKDVVMLSMPKLPDFMPVLLPLFRGHMVAAKKLRQKQMDCFVPLIRARRAFLESRKDDSKKLPDDLEVSPVGAAYIDSLFNLEVPDRGVVGEEELVTLVNEVLVGGIDTTTAAIEWALMNLVMNQEIQEKLYNEIVDKVGVDGVVNESDVDNMPYLSAIVKETYRRHPPSHFLLSHTPTETTEIGGYVIKPGMSVEFYTAWVAEDPKIWKDPKEFRPERFLEGETANVDVTGVKGSVKMVPFGAGSRMCPAWTLGTLHVSMLLARMVHKFKWVEAPGHKPDPTDTFAFSVVMKTPLKATILPRTTVK
ncbi:cytochrome P450 77A2-like [Rutidosis leptorrhynchoides]|uniref:cytochrome P450 77A2-like n=1 Tax=Rutidosis leptorrhynchoides TaxID=125765 RepID=UPI003A99A1E5